MITPVFTVVFTEVLASLGTSKANFWALMFLIVSIASFVMSYAQEACFLVSGVKLTTRLRALCFKAILRQDATFFDRPENSTGALLSKLATDADLVQGVAGPFYGAILETISAAVVSLVVAFNASWQLTLVTLMVLPLQVMGGYFQVNDYYYRYWR